MEKSFNNLIGYCIKNGIEFSDMDNETKDKLIKDICLRVVKLEHEKEELEKILI